MQLLWVKRIGGRLNVFPVAATEYTVNGPARHVEPFRYSRFAKTLIPQQPSGLDLVYVEHGFGGVSAKEVPISLHYVCYVVCLHSNIQMFRVDAVANIAVMKHRHVFRDRPNEQLVGGPVCP